MSANHGLYNVLVSASGVVGCSGLLQCFLAQPQMAFTAADIIRELQAMDELLKARSGMGALGDLGLNMHGSGPDQAPEGSAPDGQLMGQTDL